MILEKNMNEETSQVEFLVFIWTSLLWQVASGASVFTQPAAQGLSSPLKTDHSLHHTHYSP
jgi:hypothetical protein